jgi:hypothetical protein
LAEAVVDGLSDLAVDINTAKVAWQSTSDIQTLNGDNQIAFQTTNKLNGL